MNRYLRYPPVTDEDRTAMAIPNHDTHPMPVPRPASGLGLSVGAAPVIGTRPEQHRALCRHDNKTVSVPTKLSHLV
ncbi:MAG: hypothetical protein LBG27_12035 [Spirochaetaceae bacterium]|nr:hypothetical protein [Spirochaetaceae bacterium]